MFGLDNSVVFKDGGYLGVAIFAVVILLTTFVASTVLVHIFKHAYAQTRDGDRAGSIFTMLIRVAVWFVGIGFLVKACFNYDLTVVWGALGVGGIALSLGLQNTVSNLLGGLTISFGKNISIGDWISVGSVEGIITDINWRETVVVDDKGNTHSVPNSVMNSSIVTVMPEYMRVVLPLSITKTADIAQVEKDMTDIANKALDEAGIRFPDKSSVLVTQSIAADGIQASLVVFSLWTETTAHVTDVVMTPIAAYLQQNNLFGNYN